MAGWDLLEDPEPEPRPKTGSAWASLDNEPAAPSGPPPRTTSAWTSLDDAPDPVRVLPPAHLTASELSDGEVLWAQATGSTVVLGSGQPLHVPGGIPDGIGGWRRFKIVDAATLRAEALPLPISRLVPHVADEPALVFPPDPTPRVPHRPPGFPVSEGGDLTAAFEARVLRARQDFEHQRAEAEIRTAAATEQAEQRADARVREATQRYATQLRAERLRMEEDAQSSVRAATDAAAHERESRYALGAELAHVRQELARVGSLLTAESAENEKALRERGLALKAAVVGWLGVLVLLIVTLGS